MTWVALVLAGIAGFVDVYLTARALRLSGGRELNPLMVWLVGALGNVWLAGLLLKGLVMAVLVDYGQAWAYWAAVVMWGGAAVHNALQLRKVGAL
jgi:hypothetical protein